ncbi:uncharacterized protein LOC126674615 isoform X1 [Mercurialis annua]|uniref:uncharacterized protein LOC126674615 isoform X1 n=1 Tax=Mercurialis annua TaxID=3986 RepID=UPI0021606EAE|nr:uncharacterized protein LOC126674615 isoform X1 [Mercurialis annua]
MINFHKSSITGVNVNDVDLLAAAQTVGCKVDSFPIKYLGLSLTNRKLSANSWDSVVERFKSRLALWNGSLLSPAGRLPSLDFLATRSIVSVDNSLRSLCGVVETQAHILIHCNFARSVWCSILQKFDIPWPFPNSFGDFMVQWINITPKGSYWKLWQVFSFLVF